MYHCLPILLVATLILTAACAPSTTGVPEDPTLVRPLLPGTAAPAFSARLISGEEFRFDPQQLSRPVVLAFYRGGWCPYCSGYLARMRHTEEQLLEMGYDVYFLSADRPEMLASATEEGELGYTLLSDAPMRVAQTFGVAFRLDDATFARYEKAGHDLEGASGHSHHMLPVPSVFIVGRDGLIHFQYVNPNYKIRLEPEVLLAAASAAARNESE